MKQKTSRSLANLILAALPSLLGWLLNPGFARAADPDIHWQKIETAHFTIVFDSKQQALAQVYAKAAEQAWTTTSGVFGLWPDKTVILIDDETDMSNGSATGVPFPMISTYPVLPTSLDSIGDYGDWGMELLTHEYTHILTFEPATGAMRPARYIFGSIIRPNILLPRWYSEGIAVELETRLSDYGRLRSANYLSIVRSMVEENALEKEDIARINEVSIPGWPGGIRPYLMGALVWDEMIRMKGDAIVGDLNRDYSHRIPFFINGPVESRLGLNYGEILAKVYERARANAEKQLALIRAGGTPAIQKLEQSGFFNHSPVISPDGLKLAFIGKEHNVDSVINLTERADKQTSFAGAHPLRVGDGQFITRLSWLPNSTGLIYDSVKAYRHYYEFGDLYRLDLKDKKRTQLTHGVRAREATVIGGGKAILFVQNTPGATRLSSVRVDGSHLAVLYEPALQIRVSRPEPISERQFIVSEKTSTGEEIFKLFDYSVSDDGDVSLTKPDGVPVLTDYKPVHFPRLTKEGLLFVSDRSGVANLYLADRDLKTARAVSNATTRLMTGEIDPETSDLYFSRLDSEGPQIYASPREAWAQAPADPPKVGPLVDSQFPQHITPQVEVNDKPEEYNPIPYLWPRYWLPYIYVTPDGSYLSASTSGADPTGRHTYSISGAYDSLTNRPSFFGDYVNRTTQIPIEISGEDLNEYIYTGGFDRHTSAFSANGMIYLPNLSNDWHSSVGIQYLKTDIPPDLTLKRGGVQAAISWSNATRKGLEISPEKGGGFALSYTRFLSAFGDADYDETDAHVAYYFSKWLPDRHAIALSANAAIAPRLPNVNFGRTTIGGNYSTALEQTAFVMRGYPTGVFIGRNMVVTTAEYRFPLSYTYQGNGTWPFFVQRWHGDFFVDALTLDGYAYDFTAKVYQREKLGGFFLGSGAEAKVDATIFYHIPIQFIFGLYFGTNENANPNGLFPFIGFGL